MFPKLTLETIIDLKPHNYRLHFLAYFLFCLEFNTDDTYQRSTVCVPLCYFPISIKKNILTLKVKNYDNIAYRFMDMIFGLSHKGEDKE